MPRLLSSFSLWCRCQHVPNYCVNVPERSHLQSNKSVRMNIAKWCFSATKGFFQLTLHLFLKSVPVQFSFFFFFSPLFSPFSVPFSWSHFREEMPRILYRHPRDTAEWEFTSFPVAIFQLCCMPFLAEILSVGSSMGGEGLSECVLLGMFTFKSLPFFHFRASCWAAWQAA